MFTKNKIKNVFKIFAVVFVLVLSLFSIINLDKENKNVYAESVNQCLEVIGNAKIEVEADTAEINFFLKSVSDSYEQSIENVNNNFKNIKVEILNIDKESKIYINHSSVQLMRENNLNYYHNSINFNVKTKNLDKIENMVNIAIKNGANIYYRLSYLLEDNMDIYTECLTKAKENAQLKASKLFENCDLKRLKEINVYSYSQGEQSKTLVVEANVKAIYSITESNAETLLENMDSEEKEQLLYI